MCWSSRRLSHGEAGWLAADYFRESCFLFWNIIQNEMAFVMRLVCARLCEEAAQGSEWF